MNQIKEYIIYILFKIFYFYIFRYNNRIQEYLFNKCYSENKIIFDIDLGSYYIWKQCNDYLLNPEYIIGII